MKRFSEAKPVHASLLLSAGENIIDTGSYSSRCYSLQRRRIIFLLYMYLDVFPEEYLPSSSKLHSCYCPLINFYLSYCYVRLGRPGNGFPPPYPPPFTSPYGFSGPN